MTDIRHDLPVFPGETACFLSLTPPYSQLLCSFAVCSTGACRVINADLQSQDTAVRCGCQKYVRQERHLIVDQSHFWYAYRVLAQTLIKILSRSHRQVLTNYLQFLGGQMHFVCKCIIWDPHVSLQRKTMVSLSLTVHTDAVLQQPIRTLVITNCHRQTRTDGIMCEFYDKRVCAQKARDTSILRPKPPNSPRTAALVAVGLGDPGPT